MARLLLILLAAGATAGPAEAVVLRVVTCNVGGIPYLTPERRQRLAAAGPALAALKPDVISIQSAWLPEDRAALLSSLGTEGLTHSRYFRSGVFGSGLFLLSRFPIESADFKAFRVSGKPHRLSEPDWYEGKGFGIYSLRTPAGVVRVVNFHLQSDYPRTRYGRVKYAQLLQLVRGLPDGSLPLILAGELNLAADDWRTHTLTARARLRQGQDSSSASGNPILARDGGYVRVELDPFRQALEPGANFADITFSSGAARLPAGPLPRPAITAEDLKLSGEEFRGRMGLCLAMGLALLFLGAVLESGARCASRRLLLFLVLAAAIYLCLFGMMYLGPQAEGFEQAYIDSLLRE